MQGLWSGFDRLDARFTRWLSRYSVAALRIGLGVVFLWFGMLKFFPGFNPGEELATHMIETFTFGTISPRAGLVMMGIIESAVGLGLISRRFVRTTLFLLVVLLLGKVLPLFLLTGEVFVSVPFIPTLEGQSIIKNVVLLGAGLVIGSTVRGGRIVPEPNRP